MTPSLETSPPPPSVGLRVTLAVLLFPFVLVGALVLGATEKRHPLP